jgi:hypothetical protein
MALSDESAVKASVDCRPRAGPMRRGPAGPAGAAVSVALRVATSNFQRLPSRVYSKDLPSSAQEGLTAPDLTAPWSLGSVAAYWSYPGICLRRSCAPAVPAIPWNASARSSAAV